MPIAFDATGKGTGGGVASPLTYTHICTGSNLLILVGVGLDTPDASLAVTYNGVSMTLLAGPVTNTSWGTIYVFGLLAPATGTHSVSISWSSGTHFIRSISSSYTGVKQSGLPDATTSNNSNTNVASLSTTITTIADNCWSLVYGVSANPPTGGTNVTIRASNAGNLDSLGDSNAAITPPGNFTQTINESPAGAMAMLAVSFAPAVAAIAKRYGTLSMMGVGN